MRSNRAKSFDVAWASPIAVADIQDEGLDVAVEAGETERAAVARVADLRDLPRLAASFHLTLADRGEVRVVGRVSAVVGQTCVVTLERVESAVEEPIDLIFAPADSIEIGGQGQPDSDVDEDPPEPIIDGKIDLAKLTVEFLLLGIDPYPRKPGAIFETVHTPVDPADHPFAGLAGLKPPADRG